MSDKKPSKLFTWLDERFDLRPLIEFAKHKKVPMHRGTIWYYMGGVTLFLFAVQVFTGILLVFYYQPGTESSYESVQFIMDKVHFGWLFRSIHHWSANLMIFVAFVHMFSTFFGRAYKKPRELTWITGFVLLALGMGLGFSGYLLPWNTLAFFATKVGTDIAGAIPLVGDMLRQVLRGGEDVTGATLARFYAFHVALLPALFTAVLVAHLVFIQRQGMHMPEAVEALPREKRREMPFFPNFALKDALVWLIALNVLLYLAVFLPAEISEKADPFAAAPEGIRPEWYFMFMFQTLKFIPAEVVGIEGEIVGVVGFAILGLAWMLVPFWEIKVGPDVRPRPMTVIGIIAIVFIGVMTAIGYLV